ncbi:MAG: Mrp/NBP35 family ATP-binding protein [Caulobacteraceae bacterium]|nr:Mrp/NBP35 family ATP-binding protein [Caulobacteraceae bacterium]
MSDFPSRDTILTALDQVPDPKSGQGLRKAGMVRGLAIGPGRIGFMLEVAPADADLYAPVRAAAEAALRALPGVEEARVVLTAEAGPGPGPSPRSTPAGRSAALSPQATAPARPAPVPQGRPEHVKRVLAVASGKGGVGKSTVAVNLACAFARLGLRAGLLDADIYGPSAPLMLGLHEAPVYGEDRKMQPAEAFGIKAMSIGLLVDADKAMVWRGPMASRALTQMLTGTRWGTETEPLDVLVVDLPPGTGDVHLELAQKTLLDGAVVVSTPQEMALVDARRAVAMFGKLQTPAPVLGIIENMSGFIAPGTDEPIPIFGRGGAKAEAERLGVPFLGEIPIDLSLREAGDAGRPLTATRPDSGTAQAFLKIARALA